MVGKRKANAMMERVIEITEFGDSFGDSPYLVMDLAFPGLSFP